MQVAATFIAAGAKGVEMPTIESGRAAFDAALNETPKRVAPRVVALSEALGVRRAC
jgi:hypothetical protein